MKRVIHCIYNLYQHNNNMYKRFTLNELKTIQTNFIPNFFSILKKERCVLPWDFFKKIFKDWHSTYYFNRWDPIFKISEESDNYIITDEREKIEIILDEIWQRELQSIIKSYITKKEKVQWQKSIEQILIDEFGKWLHNTILGKPYIVYDIETTSNISNLKETKFLLWYYMEPKEDNTMSYKYINQDNLAEFVKYIIDFDGYIIWFNNIYFDNPVCIYNVWASNEDLEKINQKSLDLYLFIRAITGRRMWLNKLSTALIWIQKTLESWADVEKLWKKYQETWDKKIMEEFKQYCKNDVRMTALTLIYLLHYQKVFVEWEEIQFGLNDLIKKSKTEVKEIKSNGQSSMFN